ncbi:hypothetical protein N7528_000276 [Penicillium herquei]|nr:hypothetical protein N7528_000276 [Penicillium herquei]
MEIRLILPASCALIASKLPRLHTLELNLSDNEKRDKALRKHNRNDFADHFHHFPSSIKQLFLKFTGYGPENHDFAPANVVDGKIEDPLSSSLRDFSQQLTSMRLENIVVAKELFWPINPTDDTKLPTWSNLTHVELGHGITTPSGGWYFERDPEEDEIDPNPEFVHNLPEHKMPAREDRRQNSFRVKPSARSLNELYMFAGRAAQRMPRLKSMSIGNKEFGVYLHFKYEVDGTTAKATWDGRSVYTPDDPTLQAWRDAAFQHTGLELEVQLIENPRGPFRMAPDGTLVNMGGKYR